MFKRILTITVCLLGVFVLSNCAVQQTSATSGGGETDSNISSEEPLEHEKLEEEDQVKAEENQAAVEESQEEAEEDQEKVEEKQVEVEEDQEKVEEQVRVQNGLVTVPEVYLEKKDAGKQVEDLQKALNVIGYNIEVNGIYDETTTWAITDFQLQHDDLWAIGVYNTKTMDKLKSYIDNGKTVEAGSGLEIPAQAVSTGSGDRIISNPYDQLALINKDNSLPADYEPYDLVVPDIPFPFSENLPKKKMRQVAARAIEELFEAADKAGLDLYGQSGYRSYGRQMAIFNSNVKKYGEEVANTFSARPGESEHQSGLTMDVTCPDVSYQLIEEFADTDEGQWLQEHAAEYGL